MCVCAVCAYAAHAPLHSNILRYPAEANALGAGDSEARRRGILPYLVCMRLQNANENIINALNV